MSYTMTINITDEEKAFIEAEGDGAQSAEEIVAAEIAQRYQANVRRNRARAFASLADSTQETIIATYVE